MKTVLHARTYGRFMEIKASSEVRNSQNDDCHILGSSVSKSDDVKIQRTKEQGNPNILKNFFHQEQKHLFPHQQHHNNSGRKMKEVGFF